MFFHSLDQMRHLAGACLDLTGLASLPTPSRVLHESAGMRLRCYGEDCADVPVLLIVPAPIKRHWIWDLSPCCSVVRHALERRCRTHLLEWRRAPEHWGLDDYVHAIGQCIEQIESRTGRTPHLLTHSLGGTLAVLHAALCPSRLASLVLLEAPVHFGAASGAFRPLVQGALPGSTLARLFQTVPGSLLSLAAVLAAPKEFVWERQLDALSAALQGPEALRRHLLAVRWTLDELPLPGKLLAQVLDGLYREDRFMRGMLSLCGREVSPRNVRAPLAAVVDPRSSVVPPESVLGFLDAVPDTDSLLLQYRGDVGVAFQHLGVLIGRSAHREVWPRVFDWLEKVEASRR